MAITTLGAVAVPILEEFPSDDIEHILRHADIKAKLLESIFVEETLVYEMENQLVARIHPNYAYIQRMDEKKEESAIATDIAKILEYVRREMNSTLPGFSKIACVIEQSAPFVKTPTNKIKRAEYVPGYKQT
jgi:long-chain acyl-CoA synthetase